MPTAPDPPTPFTPPGDFDHELERGLTHRRAAMSDAFVERAFSNATDFSADFQNFMTRYAWQGVWGRPGLDWSSRRLIVLAVTAALSRWEEFDGHLRAALTDGNEGRLSPAQVREALIQLAIYAGVPCANTAMNRATAILRELGHPLPPRAADTAVHPGVGRSVYTRSHPRLHATLRPARSGQARATLFCSHALGLDHSMWDALLAPANSGNLADGTEGHERNDAPHAHPVCDLGRDHDVVCADTRGHGRSERPEGPCTLADLADDAARLIDELQAAGHIDLQAAPLVWVGLSMGGLVGQEFALRHGHRLGPRLAGLVLANTTAAYPPASRQALSNRLDQVRRGGLAAVTDATLTRFFTDGFRQAHPQVVARTRRRLEATDPAGYLACGAAVGEADTTSRLAQIRVPTLVIAGEADVSTPPALAQALAAGLPQAQLLSLPTAHLSMVEAPRACAQALHDALRVWLPASMPPLK